MLESRGPRRAGRAGLRRGARQRTARRTPRCSDAAGGQARACRCTAHTRVNSASTSGAGSPTPKTVHAGERRRLDAFIDTTLRIRRRYRQEPTEYYYPGSAGDRVLRAQRVSVARGVRGCHGGNRAGARRHRSRGRRRLRALHSLRQHMPLDQWRELNHSPRWSAYHFYEKGSRSRTLPPRSRHDRSRVAPAAGRQSALRSPCAMYSALAAEDANPASHGRRKLPAGRPPAADRSAGLRLPGRRRDAGVAGRRRLGVRRHDRARGME